MCVPWISRQLNMVAYLDWMHGDLGAKPFCELGMWQVVDGWRCLHLRGLTN